MEMTMAAVDEQYFIFENRLASFQRPQPVAKVGSSGASARAPKAMYWPHKSLSAVAVSRPSPAVAPAMYAR